MSELPVPRGLAYFYVDPDAYNCGMTPKLTDEMREAIRQHPGQPLTVEDDRTLARYVLLPLAVYQRAQSLFSGESLDITETYAAQSTAAGASGWDDPEMDVYNNYDAHRRQA